MFWYWCMYSILVHEAVFVVKADFSARNKGAAWVVMPKFYSYVKKINGDHLLQTTLLTVYRVRDCVREQLIEILELLTRKS